MYSIGAQLHIEWPNGAHLDTTVHPSDAPDVPDDLYVDWPPNIRVHLWDAETETLTPPFTAATITERAPT
jgi:hypothetical protein